MVRVALKVISFSAIGALLIPVLYFAGLLAWFAVVNFPFTSGVVAQASTATGEQASVVQTFKSAEPYQVSLYVRRPAEPWAWNYLAHQDTRWRTCRIEFAADIVRVYRGDTLVRELSLARATDATIHPGNSLPSQYSAQQLLAHHDRRFRQ